MREAPGIRQRVAARDALAARARRITGAALTVSAVLSGVFAGIAAASAPGHKLQSGATTQPTPSQSTASRRTSTAIPALPPPPGPGNLSAAPPPSPTPAPAPAPTQAPPVVVSGGS